jgi:hypothetical protein
LYSVYQHWDPLKVCVVGKSYNPKFYDYIKNDKVRRVFYKIAEETEEDYQKLISLLNSFGVKTLRPSVHDDSSEYLINGRNLLAPPPMTPRDYTAMIGNTFYIGNQYNPENSNVLWKQLSGNDWPSCPKNTIEFNSLPKSIKNELKNFNKTRFIDFYNNCYEEVVNDLKNNNNNIIYGTNINSAQVTRVGKDLYFGTVEGSEFDRKYVEDTLHFFNNYRCNIVDIAGHADGTFCPVKPGLIISLLDIPTYTDTFPDWEIVYLPYQSWDKVKPFLDLKEKNRGKWWVPGEELNEDFTNFVEQWMNHWVGYVEETVFDVNMLVIDEKNVVCNGYNQKVFDAFSRHGITPHVINFRHRYFWDGGLHCITSDLHREGTMQDYFPERG